MRRDELALPEPPANDRPGDRWTCGAGGHSRCSRGPDALGKCPLADACHPQRTWLGRRRRIVMIAAGVLVLVTLALTQRRFTATVFKPGHLASPHAQILAGTLTSQRCASCHPRAATAPLEWFASAEVGHQDVSQSDRCLNCHHTTIPRSTAKLAHNLPQRVRGELRLASVGSGDRSWHDWLPNPAVNQEDVDCSVCHREHRGAGADLLAVSDAQCQTCHADRFGSFATSHPDWEQWPYGRGREVAFNHATHANKHFPATRRGETVAQFQCADCHQRNDRNELARSTSYQRACKSCHDQALRIEAAEGIELLALPTLPSESAKKVEPWPESATGFYDGRLSPIAELLLRADPDTAVAIQQIPDGDFSRIDPHRASDVVAAESLALRASSPARRDRRRRTAGDCRSSDPLGRRLFHPRVVRSIVVAPTGQRSQPTLVHGVNAIQPRRSIRTRSTREKPRSQNAIRRLVDAGEDHSRAEVIAG